MDRTTVLRILGVPAADQLHDRFNMKLEHMVFERPGQPDVSIFFIGGRIVSKKVGRDLPEGILGSRCPCITKRRTKRPMHIGVARDR